MVTVFINEDTKEGKALLESLKYKYYATIVDPSIQFDKILEGIIESHNEYKRIREGLETFITTNGMNRDK